jgi:hypothetical protein
MNDDSSRKRRKEHLELLLSTLRAERRFAEAAKIEKEQFNWDASKEVSDLARIDQQVRALEGELQQLGDPFTL